MPWNDRTKRRLKLRDLDILMALARKERITVVMLGGALRRRNRAFYGAQTEGALDDLRIARASGMMTRRDDEIGGVTRGPAPHHDDHRARPDARVRLDRGGEFGGKGLRLAPAVGIVAPIAGTSAAALPSSAMKSRRSIRVPSSRGLVFFCENSTNRAPGTGNRRSDAPAPAAGRVFCCFAARNHQAGFAFWFAFMRLAASSAASTMP